MATTNKNDIKTTKKGGKDRLKILLDEVNQAVPPWDEIDVEATVGYRRESPRGKSLRILTWSCVGLLTLIGLYGVITHDRELLLALLHAAGAIGAALVLGKAAMRLFTRGNVGDEED